MAIALLVRALDWRTVVVTGAGADFASHAIGVSKRRVGSHACTMVSVKFHMVS